MGCPRCKLARGTDAIGGCRCCGFGYNVNDGREPVVAQRSPKPPAGGPTPPTPANSTPECLKTPLSEAAVRRLWGE